MQDQYIGFKLDEETKEKLKEYAKKTCRSQSGVIKYALMRLMND